MHISFVIPAYNEEKWIGPCIESIRALNDPWVHEIIVVDNASTDATAAIAGSYPGVTVVREERKGIAFARQRGLNVATGDLYAGIDADTRVTYAWLAIVKKHFTENPNLACLIGTYFYYDLPPFKQVIITILERMLRIMRLMLGLEENYARGGNTIYRMDSLRAAGGFNTGIKYFGEDIDVMERVRQHGIVTHDISLVAPSSARRMDAEGFWKMLFLYRINAIWQTQSKQPLIRSDVPDVR